MAGRTAWPSFWGTCMLLRLCFLKALSLSTRHPWLWHLRLLMFKATKGWMLHCQELMHLFPFISEHFTLPSSLFRPTVLTPVAQVAQVEARLIVWMFAFHFEKFLHQARQLANELLLLKPTCKMIIALGPQQRLLLCVSGLFHEL